jgi:hypothetical protein
MPCARCGSNDHDVSHCPWPLDIASAWLRLFEPWIKLSLTAWHLSIRTGAMLP